MRSTTRVLVAVTSVLTVLSSAGADPVAHAGHAGHAVHAVPAVRAVRAAGGSAGGDLAYVEQVMFHTSIVDFTWIADHGDPWFDWTTDWCSAPFVGSTGRTFDFRAPCRRHDFGYRNLRLMERRYGSGATFWNATSRQRVDRQLHADMSAHCRARRRSDRPTCFGWVETFYAAVRVAGGP